MWDRQDLKMRAKLAIKKNYAACVVVALFMSILAGFLSNSANRGANNYADQHVQNSYYGYSMEILGRNPMYRGVDSLFSPAFAQMVETLIAIIVICALVLVIFVGNILIVGGCRFFLLNQTSQPSMGTMLEGFRSGHYGNLALTMFLRGLYTSLWSLLFVIPGIVKSYEYLMIPYILAENPGMERKEAFLISKRMMDGKKWAAFVVDLSFIGWLILDVFTCRLLSVFYINPYREATFAEMYTANKVDAYQQGYIR